MRVERERRSAKKIIEEFAFELLNRRTDPEARTKLIVIETIAFRMGWNDLYERLRFRSGLHPEERKTANYWWQD